MLIGAFLSEEAHGYRARAAVRADHGAHIAGGDIAQTGDLLPEQLRQPVGVLGRVGVQHIHFRLGGIVDVLSGQLRQRAQRLLAAPHLIRGKQLAVLPLPISRSARIWM